MDLTPNRRAILRGACVLAGACALEVARVPAGRKNRAAAQDETPLAVALLDVHAERLEQLIASYAETQESEIEVTPLAYGELYSQLSLALTQRSPDFDVVSIDDPWIPQFASFLTPIDFAADISETIVPIAMQLARYPDEAAPCGLPWLGDAQFFAARPEWLEAGGQVEPASWDDVVAAAEAVGAELDPDDELASFAISTLTPHQIVNSFLPILRGYGKELIDPGTSIPQLDTPEAIEAVTVFQQLATMSPVESSATGSPSNIERFDAGIVAMMANFWSSARLATQEVEPVKESGPISCGQQPAQSGVDRKTMSGIWVAGIPIGSERPERARGFLLWLLSESTQRAIVDVTLPPVVAPVYADEAMIRTRPYLTQLLDLLASSTPRPRSPYYPQLELLLSSELAVMLDGQQSGEDAVRNANVAMREFLAREGVLEA
jgi:multiple sugar transport system substrate-binding protein